MTVKEELYRGFIIRAGCFEVVGADRMVTSLFICPACSQEAALVDLSTTDLTFDDELEALEATLAQGRALVDGRLAQM
jgi:hypothetical protein